jgi:hypothetical protein
MVDILDGYRPVVSCGRCNKPVSAKVVGYYDTDPGYGSPTFYELYMLAECPDCRAPFLLERSGHDDNNGIEDYINWTDFKVLHPTVSSVLDPSVPKIIARNYTESKTCYESAAFTACSIMCRRTIELICKDKEASGGNLKDKLLSLRENGVLDPRSHEWADFVLRNAGNDAAHDPDFVANKEEAKDQLDFCRAIVEYVYVFTAAFERFKLRRQASEANGGTS